MRGQGAVYFYRDHDDNGDGVDFTIEEDGQFIQVTEGENGYLQVLAKTTTFSAKPRVFVAFEQQARPVIETLTYISPQKKNVMQTLINPDYS